MKDIREKLPRIEEELQEMAPRWKFIKWFLTGAIMLLIARLWYLQILHGARLRQYSERNRLKETIIQAERGWILDRHQTPLVHNQQGLELTITPQYIHNLTLVAQRISAIIHKPPHLIIKKVREKEKQYGSFYPVTIKKHLSFQQIVLLKHLQWDVMGIDIRESIIRHYPLKKNGAHLLGYLGEISKKQIHQLNKKYSKSFRFKPGDLVGKSGLESVWEYELRGEDGFSFVEVNVHNKQSASNIAGLWSFKPKPAKRGHNLVLTIDKQLQEKAYRSLLRKDKIGPRDGAIIVMKTNGEILAWCSAPSYDPNIFSIGISNKQWQQLSQNPRGPLRNKAIQNHYAPGSIFKPIVALAALQQNIVTPKTLIHSPQHIVFKKRTYHDYRKTGHGSINIVSAIERSANVFFYKLGIELGIDAMSYYARLMHLGQKTGVQLKGEIAGFIPTTKWKAQHLKENWQEGENLSHAIGQGFILVTPLQMAVAYNTIATEGDIVKPFIVKKIIDSRHQEIKTFKPEIIKHISDSQINRIHFQTIKKALTQVVQGQQGTAKWWKVRGIKVAGKTGTAQVVSLSKQNIRKKCFKQEKSKRHHGWFVAFAPAHKPEIVVSVLTEHSCSGASGAAPVVRDIIDFYFNKMAQNTTQQKKGKTRVF